MQTLKTLGLALLIALGALGTCHAQEWPTQPVKIVVPYPPGTATDALSRVLGERLSAKWKQPVVIDNKAGGNEVVAAQAVVHAKPDGYTLFVATEVGLETNAFLFSKLPYNPSTDFTPITRMVEGPFLFTVKADSKYKTIQELIAAAKANPQSVSYGSTGPGGSIHLAVNWLGVVTGADFKQIPYRGVSLAVQDVLAGTIDFSLPPPSVGLSFVRAGQLRPLAITSQSRLSSLPDVPTLRELGYRETVMAYMFGLVGPAKMPAALANKIAADVTDVLKEPAFRERNIDPFGLAVIGGTPEEFVRFLATDREKQRARVKAANVQLD